MAVQSAVYPVGAASFYFARTERSELDVYSRKSWMLLQVRRLALSC